MTKNKLDLRVRIFLVWTLSPFEPYLSLTSLDYFWQPPHQRTCWNSTGWHSRHWECKSWLSYTFLQHSNFQLSGITDTISIFTIFPISDIIGRCNWNHWWSLIIPVGYTSDLRTTRSGSSVSTFQPFCSWHKINVSATCQLFLPSANVGCDIVPCTYTYKEIICQQRAART